MQNHHLAIVLGAAALALVAVAPAARAAERYSDAICPEATAKVIEFTDLGAQAKINLVDLRNSTHAVIDRYDSCAKQKLSDGYVEPKMHYAQTRAASFLVVAARIEAKIQDFGAAQADLDRAKSLASEVSDWMPTSQTFSSSNKASGNDSGRNTDTRPSYYRESAKEILTSITDVQAMIPKLQVQPTADAPAPKPTAKP